jgi:hypothetical protein
MHSFTVLWTKDMCQAIKRAGLDGSSPTMTFGGPHSSGPRYSRFGVAHGDTVYAVSVTKRRLSVVARMLIDRLLSAEAFVAERPDLFGPIIAAEGPISPRLAAWYAFNPGYEAEVENARRLREWLAANPAIAAFNPGEADEVVLMRATLPVGFDRVVPTSVVRELRWQQGRRPERAIKHLDADGYITSSITLQGGVYRLTPEATTLLEGFVESL